jgi:oligopeptide transport system substrate-binding protein
VPLLAVLGCLALVVTACTDEDDTTPPPTAPEAPDGLLRLGVVELTTLDPAEAVPTNHADLIAADLLHDGVTAPGPDGTGAVPALASSLDPDAELRVWTVRLRPDVVFGDGDPVRAADVKGSLERVAAKGSASIAGSRLDVIEGYRAFAVDGTVPELPGVAVVDDTTLTVTLREPYAELPELLSSPLYGVVPADADDAFFAAPEGSGPFRVTGDDGTTVSLAPQVGPAADGLSLAGAELVRFPDLDASYAEFEAGGLDWTLLPDDAVEGADVRWGGRYVPAPFGVELWLGFDLRDPRYQDVRFRQAVVHAIDRQAIVGEVFPGRLRLDGLVPDGVTGASTAPDGACGDRCAFEPDRSRALLAEAYPAGDPPAVVLATFEDPEQRALVEAVRADLEAVGLTVTVDVRPLEEYQALAPADRPAFSFGWVGLVPTQESYLGPLFLSGSPDNATGLSSSAIDLAITLARATTDPAERERRYTDVEEAVLAEVPVVPLAQVVTHQVVGERVSGFVARPGGTFALDGLTATG